MTNLAPRRLLLALAASIQLGAAPTPVVDPFAWRILAIHNSERAAAGSAPLFWDPALVAGAAGWARYLAATGQFVHSDRKARRGIGENLAMGRRGYFGVDSLVRMWSAEKRNFMPGIYPATSRTGRWLDGPLFANDLAGDHPCRLRGRRWSRRRNPRLPLCTGRQY